MGLAMTETKHSRTIDRLTETPSKRLANIFKAMVKEAGERERQRRTRTPGRDTAKRFPLASFGRHIKPQAD
jgi:hypothetical protein